VTLAILQEQPLEGQDPHNSPKGGETDDERVGDSFHRHRRTTRGPQGKESVQLYFIPQPM
jgi:hypothetical protein